MKRSLSAKKKMSDEGQKSRAPHVQHGESGGADGEARRATGAAGKISRRDGDSG